MPVDTIEKSHVVRSDWYRSLSKYEKSDTRRALWQLADTLVPYLTLSGLQIYIVQNMFSYWLMVPLWLLSAGLLVRIFIIFHDCGHGSFFNSRTANRIIGYFCGVLCFTPYEDWRFAHAEHHATVGDLDRRGDGDVWTLTVDEYLALSPMRRIAYRVFRNPFVLFVLGAPAMFLVLHRMWHRGVDRRERNSVIITNLLLVAVIGIAWATIGIKAYLLVQAPSIWIAGIVGVWMFYVQHQFIGVYWARHDAWDPMRAAIEGSSYYKLPSVLQWFTGSIGLHHLHHLKPRIPNYNLQKCHDEVEELHRVKELRFFESMSTMFLKLWDERNNRMVGFSALREYIRMRQQTAVGSTF